MMYQLRPLILILGMLFGVNSALADGHATSIGKLKTIIYLASNEQGEKPTASATPASAQDVKKMQSVSGFNYIKYYKLGEDTTPIYKGLENWSLPLKPSKAITLSYEPAGAITDSSIKMTLDLWQGNEKIMKSSASILKLKKTMFIRGPKWKNGYLILGVEVIKLTNK